MLSNDTLGRGFVEMGWIAEARERVPPGVAKVEVSRGGCERFQMRNFDKLFQNSHFYDIIWRVIDRFHNVVRGRADWSSILSGRSIYVQYAKYLVSQ